MGNRFNYCCPNCGSPDEIEIDAIVTVRLTSTGTEGDASNCGPKDWTDGSLPRLRISAADSGGSRPRICISAIVFVDKHGQGQNHSVCFVLQLQTDATIHFAP